ncbi:hypothetical protein BH24CHL4_BH24CHL4_23250 [soil metagenome]
MRVLLAIDGSADGNAAAELLLGLDPSSGIMAMVLAVAPTLPLLGSDLEAPPGIEADDEIDVARAIVDITCERLRAAGHDATPMVRRGNPVEEILAAGRETAADVIVLGSRGVGRLRRLLVGSVASSVARLAEAPVLLVSDPAALATALIAVDGSSGSERAIETFRSMPPSALDRAILLHVGSAAPAPQVFEPALAAMRDSGVDVTQQTAHGNEVDEILRVADEEQVSVIVIGASLNRVDGEPLLGTTANGVINRASCSILIGR